MHEIDIDRPYIQFENVSKAFGENVVLRDVSFDVKAGETVCILGRSGVGKSVALHHIMGFLKPDSGRVLVAREDITDYSENELERIRKKVTMVFQNGALFDSLSVGENVAFPLRERRDLTEAQIYQVVDGLLEMVNVSEYREQLPSGLSTGMKRSVAIARALAAEPDDGGPLDGSPPRRPDQEAEIPVEADQHRGDTRHDAGEKDRRPHRLSARGGGCVLRNPG
jgi:phospholipid/cholesterol/gamma-HCH transport system ATP-binding protein